MSVYSVLSRIGACIASGNGVECLIAINPAVYWVGKVAGLMLYRDIQESLRSRAEWQAMLDDTTEEDFLAEAIRKYPHLNVESTQSSITTFKGDLCVEADYREIIPESRRLHEGLLPWR